MSSNQPSLTTPNVAQFNVENTQLVYAPSQPQTVYVAASGPQQVQPPARIQTQGVTSQMYNTSQPGEPGGGFSAQRQSTFGQQTSSFVNTSSMSPAYTPPISVQNQTGTTASSQLYGSHMSSYFGQPGTLSNRPSPASTLPPQPSSTSTLLSGLPTNYPSVPPPVYPMSPTSSGTPLPLYPHNTGVSTTSSFTSPSPSFGQSHSQQTAAQVDSVSNPSQLKLVTNSTPVGAGTNGSIIGGDGIMPSPSAASGSMMGSPQVAQGRLSPVQDYGNAPLNLQRTATSNGLISSTPPPSSASPIQVQPQPQVQSQNQPLIQQQLQTQLQYQQHPQQQQQQQQPQFYVTPEGYLLPVTGAPNVIQQQPQPTMGMSIQPGGGGNRNLKNLPYDAQGLREWSFEILDCCGDSETCLAALLCPCVMHSANEKRHQYLETHGTYDPEHGGPWCSENCWDYVVKMGVAIFVGCCTGGLACCCRMPCLTQISPRQRLRARYNIVGTPSTDCTAAILCSSCALTQESRELELEEMSLGWTRPVPATHFLGL